MLCIHGKSFQRTIELETGDSADEKAGMVSAVALLELVGVDDPSLLWLSLANTEVEVGSFSCSWRLRRS